MVVLRVPVVTGVLVIVCVGCASIALDMVGTGTHMELAGVLRLENKLHTQRTLGPLQPFAQLFCGSACGTACESASEGVGASSQMPPPVRE